MTEGGRLGVYQTESHDEAGEVEGIHKDYFISDIYWFTLYKYPKQNQSSYQLLSDILWKGVV